jgi:hypothetical protein
LLLTHQQLLKGIIRMPLLLLLDLLGREKLPSPRPMQGVETLGEAFQLLL